MTAQHKVYQMVLKGQPIRCCDIAKALGIEATTVAAHLSNLKRKYGCVRTTTEGWWAVLGVDGPPEDGRGPAAPRPDRREYVRAIVAPMPQCALAKALGYKVKPKKKPSVTKTLEKGSG